MGVSSLQKQLEEAEARAAQLRQQIAAAPCSEVGHRWKFIGGKSCGCEPGGHCSVPVHECTACGDCDYGENAEAEGIRAECDLKTDDVAAQREEPGP